MHKPTWRVISILNYISRQGKAGLVECASAIDIPVGTIYPILQTLSDVGYLNYDSQTRQYSIGLDFFLAGSRYAAIDNGYSSMSRILSDAAGRCGGETVHLARLDGGNVLYLMKIESTCSVRTYSSVGISLPAYGTALGKALLSDLDERQVMELYPDGLKPITENTITSFDVLFSQLDDVRRCGFAYEREESNYDVACVAMPLRVNGRVMAAISVAMPVFRYSVAKKNTIENELAGIRDSIEAILPYMLGNMAKGGYDGKSNT